LYVKLIDYPKVLKLHLWDGIVFIFGCIKLPCYLFSLATNVPAIWRAER